MTFSSERRFQVFSFTISHGQLLLRSGKTNTHRTRLNILFKDVRAVELRMWFDSLSIEEVEPSLLKDLPAHPTELIESGNRCFVLKSLGWQGYIVGATVFYHEDELNFWDPTPLLSGHFSGARELATS
jgi:hypothetical protein